MRYVRGGDAGTLARRHGPLPAARVAALIAPVASALDAAHAAGLVHRDVKPANMLLEAQPGRPDHVYLSDFGLSKAWQGSTRLTGSGLFLGTLDYAAPEQIEGRPVDGRTDLYSLGCAAFELLAGEPPFRRDQPMAVMYAHVTAPPPALTQRRADLPPAVDQVFARVLAKSPADRYGSCGELAAELRRALGLAARDDAGPGGPPPGPAATVLGPGRGGRAAAHPVPGMVPAGPDRGGPAPRRPRWRLPAAALAAAALVAGGVSTAIALSAGHQPSSHQTVPPPTHQASASSAPPTSQPPSRAPTQSAAASPGSGPGTPAGATLTLFRVCTFPADTCNSRDLTAMKAEPAQIVTSADGSGFVKELTWSGWGTATALGSGLLEIDNCIPNCAQGTFTGYQARVTLWGLTRYGRGAQAYADMTITAPGSPAPQENFDTGLVP
jgi:serine/threonine protein kinase